MKAANPKTPQAIRDLIRADVTEAQDAHLLAILLITDSRVQRVGLPRKSRTCVELAEAVLEVIGGGWDHLVDQALDDAMDLPSFGISLAMGARLLAGVELSRRWRRGFRDSDKGGIRSGAPKELQKRLYERRGKLSATELVAVILGGAEPDEDTAKGLMEAIGGPRQLVDLTLDDFESFRQGSALHLRLSDVTIDFRCACRLIAAIELARRYRARKGPELPALKAGMFGLESPLLAELLDPVSRAPSELREATLEMLRSHPKMASDFAKLRRLARDAGTSDFQQAIQLSLMFELLRERPSSTHPTEVLGEQVPYEALLAIARARIERSPKRPVRLLKIEELLERASRQLPEDAIDSFAEALARRKLPEAVADLAIEEARRRYFEIAGSCEQAGAA